MSTDMENVFRIGKQASVLPAGYIQLEYIESTGWQYIDTGFKFTTTSKIELETLITSNTGFMGSINENINRVRLGVSSGKLYNQLALDTNLFIEQDNQYHKYTTTATEVYIDNLQATITGFENQTINYCIFGQNDARTSAISAYLAAKLKYLKIWDNNVLVHNFIPAKRNSDNVVGMYDLVSNTFFTNSGTGSFTAGPAVEVCKISQNNQTIWERAVSLESDKDSEVTFRSTRNESKNLVNPNDCRNDWSGVPTTGRWGWIFDIEPGDYFIKLYNAMPAGKAMYVRYSEDDGVTWTNYSTINITGFTYTATVKTKLYVYASGSISKEDVLSANTSVTKTSTAPTTYQPYWNTLPELNAYGNTAQPSAIKPYVKTAISTTPTTFNSELAGPLNVLADGKTEQRNIPVEYQELEYIESTGGQWIDTGYVFNSNTVLDFEAYLNINAPNFFLGSRISPSEGYSGLTVEGGSVQTNFRMGTSTIISINQQLIDNKIKAHIENGNSSFTYDDTTVTSTSAYGNSWDTNNATLFRFANYTGAGIIYYCKISENSNLVRNFIPAKRLSDNVLGMYDTVSQTFFTNAGSGTFTAGPDAKPTPDKPMNIVSNNGVIKYGYKDIDTNLPTGYDKLEYIVGDGDSYMLSDSTTISDNTGFEYEYDATSACYVTGSTYSDSARIAPYISNSANQRFDNTTYLLTQVNLGHHTSKIDKTGFTFDGTHYNFTSTPSSFSFTGRYGICCSHNVVTEAVFNKIIGKLYWLKRFENDVLKEHYVPAKRNSDNAIGVYEIINGKFFENIGTSSFTAGPVIQREIYVDGTQEKLVFANNCGVVDLGTLNWSYQSGYQYFNSTSLAGIIKNASNWAEKAHLYCSLYTTTHPDDIYGSSGTHGNKLITVTPAGAVGITNHTYTDATAFKQSLSGVYLYYQRTTDSSWNAPTISNVEMLNKVGTYTDIQDIVKGSVTKNVGIKVLDGTEDWTLFLNSFYIKLTGLKSMTTDRAGYCTHFKFDTRYDVPLDGEFIYNASPTNGNISFKKSDITDVESWKAYLASEYAKGTPVIIMYPLATSTTETVTAQPITQAVGTNIATISEGSLTGLVGEVSGINQTQTTPTPESPLDIVSNNGAIKYDYVGTQGVVDLGTLNWIYHSSSGNFYVDDVVNDRVNGTQPPYCSAYCSKYNLNTTTTVGQVAAITNDKTISFQHAISTPNVLGRIIIRDINYTDATAFKQAMSGIKLFYQRATDTEYVPPVKQIVTEGTQEKITVSDGTNVLDKYGIVQPNVMYEVNFIGQNFVASCANTGTVRFRWYDENKTQINYYTLNDVDTTLNRKYKYARFTETKYTKYVMFETTDSSDFKLELDVSTPTKYVAPQTVVAGMLNKIGTYQDIQNIVNGSVSKNVGIKVLDGVTDDLKFNRVSPISTFYYSSVSQSGIIQNMSVFCTHFLNRNAVMNYVCYAGTNNITFHHSFSVLEDANAWLASEYAKGTPVIVLYPLATPTTESVAAQDIDINKGTYTAEVTEASLADLDISVKYLGNE